MYLKDTHKVWLATSDHPIYLEPSMANRHGLIAGAARRRFNCAAGRFMPVSPGCPNWTGP